ncbi:MAG TPA: hypothetical protein VG326_12065 [Tepidisphaeraceae bacterium]|nr:hypothetical protein [Tepidisphaeraceae bacterium]
MLATVNAKIEKSANLHIPRPESAPPWPAGVELILTAIEAGQFSASERRRSPRASYRVQAMLQLFSDLPGLPPRDIYTRDANERGLGFITPHRLPLGYGGMLEIVRPDGERRTIQCTLLRCREAAPDWYEGSLYFNRQQMEFSA